MRAYSPLLTILLTAAYGACAEAQPNQTATSGRRIFPDRASRQDVELAGKYILAFSNQQENTLEPILRYAETSTICGSTQTMCSHQQFLELWGEQNHWVTGIETQREGEILTVTVREEGHLYKLTHRLEIEGMDSSDRLRRIALEIPNQKEEIERKEESRWRSISLGEAESQFLASLARITPTWKTGKATFEEGPDLEATAFAIHQPHKENIGVGIVVRNKSTGETLANVAFEKNPAETAANKSFRKLKDKTAEKMAGDPIFQHTETAKADGR